MGPKAANDLQLVEEERKAKDQNPPMTFTKGGKVDGSFPGENSVGPKDVRMDVMEDGKTQSNSHGREQQRSKGLLTADSRVCSNEGEAHQ